MLRVNRQTTTEENFATMGVTLPPAQTAAASNEPIQHRLSFPPEEVYTSIELPPEEVCTSIRSPSFQIYTQDRLDVINMIMKLQYGLILFKL